MMVSVEGEESVHLSLDGSNHSFAKVNFVIILGDVMMYIDFFQESRDHLIFTFTSFVSPNLCRNPIQSKYIL